MLIDQQGKRHAEQIDELVENLLQKPHPLLVILGPTASGKTALSIALAKKFNGEIISADSRQIYRTLDISTDKITKPQRENIPHHLIDIRDPDEIYTVGEYKRDAVRAISEIHKKNRLPLLVGGTGLYIRSITENFQIPRVPPQKDFRILLEKQTTEELYEKLQKEDQNAASSIHPNNRRYIIRALEINQQTGHNKNDQKEKSPYSICMVGLDWPRDELDKRINERVEQQIARGLFDEIKSLLEKGYDPDLPSMSAIGCKEIIPYLEGKITLEEAKEIVKKNTRAYARRQMTWFKKDRDIEWINELLKNDEIRGNKELPKSRTKLYGDEEATKLTK